MPKIVKVFSEDEVRRQVHFILQEHQAPGLLRFLSSLPYGAEGAWWRGVAALWLQEYAQAPDLEAKICAVMAAGGGDGAASHTSRKQRAPRKTPALATNRMAATPRASAISVAAQPLPATPAPNYLAASQPIEPLPTHQSPNWPPSSDVLAKEQAFLDDFEIL